MQSAEGQPLSIVPLAVTLSAFFAVTFLLCLVAGLILPTSGMRMALEAVLPGFVWLGLTSVIVGLFWSLAYAWYIAVLLVPIRNYVYRQLLKTRV